MCLFRLNILSYMLVMLSLSKHSSILELPFDKLRVTTLYLNIMVQIVR